MRIEPVDLLRQRGLRATAQRMAVLRVVSGEPHVTADAVAKTVRREIGAISLQGVYDALGVLVDADLIRRMQPAGSPARFEARVADNHHHVICRVCGRMSDVDCAVGSPPCLTAVDDLGFVIDEAEVIYWGRCPACVAATSVARDGGKRAPSGRRAAAQHGPDFGPAGIASDQRPEGSLRKRKGAT